MANMAMIDPVAAAQNFIRLAKAGAELIIGGHAHHYERFAPLDPDGSPDPARGLYSGRLIEEAGLKGTSEGGAQFVRVPHQSAASLQRGIQPFVRVDSDRVRFRQSLQFRWDNPVITPLEL